MRSLRGTNLFLFLLIASAAPALAGGAGKDFEAAPQTKAYRALLKTVDAGDFAGYKKAMTAESAKGMDAQLKETGMTEKQAMAFLKTMSPTELKVTSIEVESKKATLKATGKSGGELSYGTVEMAEEDGQWKVARQSWSNKPE